MTQFTDIAVSKHGNVAQVKIRRAPHNFFDMSLIKQIADAFEGYDKDVDVRAIVLCAEGKSFCAGANFGDGSKLDKDGNPGYWSLLIVRKDSDLKSVEDVIKRGKDLSYGAGDPNSTSGTAVPGYYLWAANKVDPKSLFKAVRISNRLYNGTTPLDTIPAHMIERIEIMEGGQGLFYGTQAVAGAVNVVTKSFAAKYPAAVQLWLDQENAAVKQIQGGDANAIASIAAELNITPDEVKTQIKGLTFVDATEQASPTYFGTPQAPGKFAASLLAAAEFLKTQGKIDAVPPLATPAQA